MRRSNIIYPSLSESTSPPKIYSPFKHLYASLSESTPPSHVSNLGDFLKNLAKIGGGGACCHWVSNLCADLGVEMGPADLLCPRGGGGGCANAPNAPPPQPTALSDAYLLTGFALLYEGGSNNTFNIDEHI